MNIEKLLKERKGTILDVRSPGEYEAGHATGAINIPLQEIPQRMEEIKSLNQPLVVCCASGMRSGKAQGYLSQVGVECYNAGSWLDIKSFHDQHVHEVGF